MDIAHRMKFLDKLLPNKDNIYLDYLSFYEKSTVGEEYIYNSWKGYLKENGDSVQFYLHIPFCSRICKFCMYNTIKLTTQMEIESYIDTTISFLEKYKFLFLNRSFDGIYVGGGTPSILSVDQFQRLFGYIFHNFKFNDDYYKTIEMNPSSTDFSKIEVLKKLGFDRLSFGVQSFHKKTLQIENRTYVSPERIKQLVDFSKKIGFYDVSLDFILGMNDETGIEMIKTIKKINKIQPYSVTFYTILKDIERSILYKNDRESFYGEINKIFYSAYQDSGISNDYDISLWSNVLGYKLLHKQSNSPKGIYEAHSTDKKSLFGVGYKAYGKIWGIGDYETQVFSSGGSLFGFEKSSQDLEKIRYILKQFQFKIYKDDYLKRFGVNFDLNYNQELIFLKKNSIIHETLQYYEYIGDPKRAGYYGLLFLDIKNLLKLIKNRYY